MNYNIPLVRFNEAWGSKTDVMSNPDTGLKPGEMAKCINTKNNDKWIMVGTRFGTIVVCRDGKMRTVPEIPDELYRSFALENSLYFIFGNHGIDNIGVYFEKAETPTIDFSLKSFKTSIWERVSDHVKKFFLF